MKRGTQKQIAEKLGVHPSTVSRKVAKNDLSAIVTGLVIESQSNISNINIPTNDIRTTDSK